MQAKKEKGSIRDQPLLFLKRRPTLNKYGRVHLHMNAVVDARSTVRPPGTIFEAIDNGASVGMIFYNLTWDSLVPISLHWIYPRSQQDGWLVYSVGGERNRDLLPYENYNGNELVFKAPL